MKVLPRPMCASLLNRKHHWILMAHISGLVTFDQSVRDWLRQLRFQQEDSCA